MGGFFALTRSAESFGKCVTDRKNHKAYAALHDKRGFPVDTIVRLELSVGCGLVTIGENDGLITAFASILVAIFTFTLWKTTERLWKAGDLQLAAFKDSLVHAETSAQAAAKGADAATKSANAAEKQVNLAADAFDRLERPHVFITVEPTLITNIDAEGVPNCAEAQFIIANHGRLPADVTGVYAGVTQIGFEPQPGLRFEEFHHVIGAGDKSPKYLVPFPGGAIYDYVYPDDAQIEGDRRDLLNVELRPQHSQHFETFFRIGIWYKGLARGTYQTHRCWVWNHCERRWIEYGREEYNYRT